MKFYDGGDKNDNYRSFIFSSPREYFNIALHYKGF